MSIEAYPLQWPMGYPRTAFRIKSKFQQTMDQAQKFLHAELERLGASNLVVSTNIPVKTNGMLYANSMNKKLDDPGVAIYFKYKGKDVSMCCDNFERVWENVYALGRTISALRQIARDGVSDFINRSFTGFTGIPETTTPQQWFEVLGVPARTSTDVVKAAYRKLALKHHPDKGGNADEFSKIHDAYLHGLSSSY